MINWIKRHWKILLGGLLLLLVIGLIISRSSNTSNKLQITTHAQVKDLQKTLDVSGVVDAKEKADLRFLAGGKVTYVGAKEGDVVKKWQTIASIDAASLKKSLQQNLNTFSSTRIGFDQTIDTNKDIHGNTAVDRTLSQSDLSLQNSALTVELADLAIKNTSLYSPIDGVLYASPTDIAGVILTASDVFSIANPKTLYFVVDVDEADIGLVKTGQTVSISLDAYPDAHISATVSSIAFQSTQGKNGTTYKVKIDLPQTNESAAYKLGMNGTAHILISEKLHVLSVPLTALIERDGKSYVEVLKNNKAAQAEIQKGMETDTEVEIVSGVSEQDEVVVQ